MLEMMFHFWRKIITNVCIDNKNAQDTIEWLMNKLIERKKMMKYYRVRRMIVLLVFVAKNVAKKLWELIYGVLRQLGAQL